MADTSLGEGSQADLLFTIVRVFPLFRSVSLDDSLSNPPILSGQLLYNRSMALEFLPSLAVRVVVLVVLQLLPCSTAMEGVVSTLALGSIAAQELLLGNSLRLLMLVVLSLQ